MSVESQDIIESQSVAGKLIGDATKIRPIKRIDYAAGDKPGAFDSDSRLKLAAASAKYDEQGVIDEVYQLYLNAIQRRAPRIMTYATKEDWARAGYPRWDSKSSFRDYCYEARITCEFRLEEIAQKKKDKKPLILYSSVGDYLQQVKGGMDNFEPSDKALMYSSDPEVLEIQEMVCRKNMQTFTKYIQGKLQVTNPKITEEDIVKGLGIENWDNSKKEDIIKKFKSIPQKIITS